MLLLLSLAIKDEEDDKSASSVSGAWVEVVVDVGPCVEVVVVVDVLVVLELADTCGSSRALHDSLSADRCLVRASTCSTF